MIGLVALRVVRVLGVTAALVVVIGALIVAAWARDASPAEPYVRHRPDALQIVALGDSYMSGEGAATFYKGTDRRRDACRRAPTAYPVLMAKALDADLTFTACSGAKTINIADNFDDPDTIRKRQNQTEPLQIKTLRAHADADVVILGIGGNDAGFSKVVMTCSGKERGCVDKADPWLSSLDPLIDEATPNAQDGKTYFQQSLRDVMQQIRAAAPHARYYITTYPNPLSAERCDAIGMDEAETRFLTDVFLPRLNGEIELAAAFEQFTVIPLFDVFAYAGLCARDQQHHGPAMNAWRFQKTDGFTLLPNSLLRGSMHPTEAGHRLIAARVEAVVRDDLARPPAPLPPGPPPGMGGPEGLPPIDIPPPGADYDVRANRCTTHPERARFEERPEGALRVTDARPSSTACVAAAYLQRFEKHSVDADGTLVVETAEPVSDPGGRREALYQDADGAWV